MHGWLVEFVQKSFVAEKEEAYNGALMASGSSSWSFVANFLNPDTVSWYRILSDVINNSMI